MKKYYASIRNLGVLFITLAMMAACSSDNDIVDEQPPVESQVYTMTVQASKGSNDATTRALTLDGSTLNATWTEGDRVHVYDISRSVQYGNLYAQSDGTSATLVGTLYLNKTPTVGQSLFLQYNTTDYYRQDGTLTGGANSIDKVCDYATATVTVNTVNTVDGKYGSTSTINTSDATFENQQAIVKFILRNADGSALPSSPTALTISDGTNDLTRLTDIPDATYTTNGDGVLYVAIPGFSDKTVSLTATVGSDLYTYKRNNVTFENSKYYAITVKMTKQSETLLSLKNKINASEDCSSYLGWEVNSDGIIAENNVIGTKIGYIGYFSTNDVDTNVSGSRILVLASSDASSGAAWASAASAAESYSSTIPSGGASPARWFLPEVSQYSAIISALGGYSTFKEKVGWSSALYWSSTSYDADHAFALDEKGEWSYYHFKNGEYHVRACFAY